MAEEVEFFPQALAIYEGGRSRASAPDGLRLPARIPHSKCGMYLDLHAGVEGPLLLAEDFGIPHKTHHCRLQLDQGIVGPVIDHVPTPTRGSNARPASPAFAKSLKGSADRRRWSFVAPLFQASAETC